MCYACKKKSFYGTHAEMKVEGEIHMAGLANTGLRRVLIVLLVLALIIMFAFVVLLSNHFGGYPDRPLLLGGGGVERIAARSNLYGYLLCHLLDG